MRQLTRTDDANTVTLVFLGMCNDQQSTPIGHTDDEITILFPGMVWIRNRDGQRIAENCRRFRKRDIVLAKVAGCFVGIPLELHANSIPNQNRLC